jgi:hypothetical protein
MAPPWPHSWGAKFPVDLKEVFGPPESEPPAHKEDNNDGRPNVEDTSDGISCGDDGEKESGFDGDFCINFRNCDTFTSL